MVDLLTGAVAVYHDRRYDKEQLEATINENLYTLRQKNKSTGELLNGTYLFASNMVIVERIDRETVERIIDHMLDTDSFYYMFAKHQN
jgi:hypothetical protein